MLEKLRPEPEDKFMSAWVRYSPCWTLNYYIYIPFTTICALLGLLKSDQSLNYSGYSMQDTGSKLFKSELSS